MAAYRFSLMRILGGVLFMWLAVIELRAADPLPSRYWPVAPDKSSVFMVHDANDVERNGATVAGFEPSGVIVSGDWLYVVSDNGRIGRKKLNDAESALKEEQVQKLSTKHNDPLADFESITTVPGDSHFYLGVEGKSDDHPRIVRYQPPSNTVTNLKDHKRTDALGDATTQVFWILSVKGLQDSKDEEVQSGMEAMTFIPDGFHPFPVANQENRAFRGVFLVSSQKQDGLAFAYDLKTVTDHTNGGAVAMVGSLKIPSRDKPMDGIKAPLRNNPLSDLFFSTDTDTLFALYDQAASKDTEQGARHLQELVWSPGKDGTPGTYIERRFWAVGFQYQSTERMHGVEAVALAPNGDLYLGLDQGKTDEEPCKNGNCLGDCTGKKDDECDKWDNYVYRYSGFWKEEFPTGLPDISGMVLIEQDAGSAKYLLARDIKSHKPDSRLLVLTVTKEGRQRFEPVAVDFWNDPDGRPSDLEGVCKLANIADEYLLLESGYWTGDTGNIDPPQFGRVFRVKLKGSADGWTAEVLNVAHLPNEPGTFRRVGAAKFYDRNYEGIACLTFDVATKTATLLLADRSGTISDDGTVNVRLGVGTIYKATVDFSAINPIVQEVVIASLVTNHVEGPTHEKGAKFRQCTDLYLEPIDATRSRLWTASSYDPDLDDGPFRSQVYLVGTLAPTSTAANLEFLRATDPVPWTLHGVKVEAIGASPKFWETTIGNQPPIGSRISVCTDDEHLGGIWRPLPVKMPPLFP